MIRLLALILVLLTAPAVAAEPPPVILVSIDGFRPDYLDRGVTPNLSALAAEGVLTPHELAEAAYQRMFADPTAL